MMNKNLKELLATMHEVYEARVSAGVSVSISALEREYGVGRGLYKNYRANRLRTKEAIVSLVSGLREGAVRRVDLDGVRWWENAREVFDAGELEGLADSLKDTGDPLQFPVGWMEQDEGGGEVFVGFIGERRYRAMLLRRDRGDEVSEMLVRVVAQPSPRDALKWGLVENTQRSNLRPTEEARAIGRMLEMEDEVSGVALWSMRSLAEEMGKPVSHVAWSLGALEAPKRVLDLLDGGRTSLELAGRIGRLPAGIREAATDRLVGGLAGPLALREARRVLAEEFRRDLRRADFDRTEEGLAGVAACTGCRWYGPNRDDVEGEAARDVCLDPSCFLAKQRALASRERLALMEGGHGDVVLLEDEVAERIFDEGGKLSPTAGYVELSARPDAYWMVDGERNASSRPRWREALEEVCPTVLLAWDGEGRRRELVETALAVPAALQGRHGSLFRAEAGADLLSAEERRSLSEARNAAARASREVALSGARELLAGLSREVSDWPRLMRVVELAGGLLCKRDDFAFLCDVVGSGLPQAQQTERGFYEYLRNSGMDGDGLVAVLVLMLGVRRLRYEGYESWVESGPMADLVTEAGVDGAAWRRRWKRARKVAEERGEDEVG